MVRLEDRTDMTNPITTMSDNPPPYEATVPAFNMNPTLILSKPPPLDPAWLAHENTANLLSPAPAPTSVEERQRAYSQSCERLNLELLSSRDKHLTEGITVFDTCIEIPYVPIRSYNPSSLPSGPPEPWSATSASGGKCSDRVEPKGVPIVIYFHGGGLYVGDLDSEDLTCRRICKELECTVYSVAYRLMPSHSASTSLSDAMAAFRIISSSRKASRLVIMGSSSGGQLAAQISQFYRTYRGPHRTTRIHGVLLRVPVTCDATEGGVNLPTKFRGCHTSMSKDFYTSLLSSAAVNAENRTEEPLPLEAEHLEGMPRHWIQVSTNDIYYSDGACYAEALRDAGVNVKLDIVVGWPHTFWLKAPFLERAVQAERDMLDGLRWLLESPVEPDEEEEPKWRAARGDDGAFVAMSNAEFERKFMNV